jgi:hypothetical protein
MICYYPIIPPLGNRWDNKTKESKMKKEFLKMIILILMMGSSFPGFSQEKNIKMEVFEKIEEVLPFTAVDKNGSAVTNLEKREIV